MSPQVWEFLPPTSPCPSLSTFGWSRPPPVRADTRLALFETLQLKNNSHWRVKKLIILFENNVRMKTIFEMMSFHCVPHILYWIQAEWKFYIQTYRQIIWVNFTNMVAIIFFQSGRPHLAKPPPPPPTVRICPLLPDLHTPNVHTSFMDGPSSWLSINSRGVHFTACLLYGTLHRTL